MSRDYLMRILLVGGFATGFAANWQLAASSACAADPSAEESAIGREIPPFVLPDIHGKEVGLGDFKDQRAIVVIFLGAECPISNAYVPVLEDLQREYRGKQVQIIGVHSQPGRAADELANHAQEFGITFPVLHDVEQTALTLFGARRTAEAYLLDARRVVRYRGRIDDRFGYAHKRSEAKTSELTAALDELLAGKSVSAPETDPAGCLITRRERKEPEGAVTFASHIKPLLSRNCATCHHEGTAAPFSLTTFEDAANWSEMIREVVTDRRMPPWHADPRYGKFDNERRLTQDEIDTITSWVDDGAPAGEPAEELAGAAPVTEESPSESQELVDGWRIGKPDAVFQMPREFTVPAQGEVKYQYFMTKTNFTADMWLQAAEVRPGNRGAVHHIIVLYKDPKNPGAAPTWIAATAPGADPLVFREGLGRKIPAGAELVWQVHYTPTGKEEKDLSQIGLIFCKEPPRHDVITYGIANHGFVIPAGEANQEVVSTVPIVKDAVVLAFFPHMHLRGKDFEFQAVYPDGHKDTLLSVPRFDFNWQSGYRLETPLRVPQGSWIRCVAHFDNSPANPANPDATQEVRWGDQTWEEMMIGYVDYYYEDAGT